MKYFLILCTFIFITGCGADPSIDQEALVAYEVKQTFDEVKQDDFVFRLNSEKEVYEQGEQVNLFAEIIYVGEEETIEISHSEFPVYFTLHEKVRDYHITSMVREIGAVRTLAKDRPDRIDYKKQAVNSFGDEEAAYKEFIEDFTGRGDYPPGYYAVKATAMFHDGETHREIEAEVDFKVE